MNKIPALLFICIAFGAVAYAQLEKRPDLEASNRAIVITGERPKVATGPLKQSAVNPNYFQDASGKPVLLIGSHTWSNFQDMGMEGDNNFDYDRYIAFMVHHRYNFMRFWNWEHGAWATWSQEKMIISPMPYQRTGPGLALDGKPKYDLTQFNEAYFDRMRARIIRAKNHGIYASVMLFQAFSGVWPKGGNTHTGPAFNGHYYNVNNNIQKMNGDKNYDRILDIDDPGVRKYQVAYIKKIIDHVWDLDNVLYEVINEGGNPDWDKFVVKTVRDYEKIKGKSHPIGITGHGAESTDMVMAGDADWVSPGPWDKGGFENAWTDPPLWTGKKVCVQDTDHLWGHGMDYHWVWYAFLRGHNILFMDTWDPIPAWHDPYKNTPDLLMYTQGRTAMTTVSMLAAKIDLEKMKPVKEFESGFCLADAGKEYVIYVKKGNNEIDLTNIPGTFSVEWINLSETIFLRSADVKGGGKTRLVNPFSDDAVVHLALTGTN